METFLLYLFTRLDPINNAVSVLSFLGVVCCVALAIFYFIIFRPDLDPEQQKRGDMMYKQLVYGTIIAVVVHMLVPTQKDAVFILAGTGVLEAARSDTAKRVASKSVQAIEAWLDKQIPPAPAKE